MNSEHSDLEDDETLLYDCYGFRVDSRPNACDPDDEEKEREQIKQHKWRSILEDWEDWKWQHYEKVAQQPT
jgi:hypothetical protein